MLMLLPQPFKVFHILQNNKKISKINYMSERNHKIGWTRSFYYWMGWEYNSNNDKPSERDVHLKQILMRQVSLSKLKLNKTKIEPKISPDLQPINKEIIKVTPYCPIRKANIPIKKKRKLSETFKDTTIKELSQKQRQQQHIYKCRLDILKNL